MHHVLAGRGRVVGLGLVWCGLSTSGARPTARPDASAAAPGQVARELFHKYAHTHRERRFSAARAHSIRCALSGLAWPRHGLRGTCCLRWTSRARRPPRRAWRQTGFAPQGRLEAKPVSQIVLLAYPAVRELGKSSPGVLHKKSMVESRTGGPKSWWRLEFCRTWALRARIWTKPGAFGSEGPCPAKTPLMTSGRLSRTAARRPGILLAPLPVGREDRSGGVLSRPSWSPWGQLLQTEKCFECVPVLRVRAPSVCFECVPILCATSVCPENMPMSAPFLFWPPGRTQAKGFVLPADTYGRLGSGDPEMRPDGQP